MSDSKSNFILNEINKDINILKDIKNNQKNVNIYIFGSYAWGNPKNSSDLDIAIETDNLNVFFDVQEDIEESNIPKSLDILHLNTLFNKNLREKIIKDGFKI